MEAHDMDPAFNNRFTRAFGQPLERIRTKMRDYLPDPIKDFIGQSPFMVLATSDREGRCDASPKGGKPGFVRILDDRHLLVPDVSGNKLFQSYQNMDGNGHVGMIFFIPGLSEVCRVNGRVSIVGRAMLDENQVEESMWNPDGDRAVLQGIVVEVEEAYTHCPRAINYANLWDPDNIEDRRRSGIHPLRTTPPAPAAKG